MDAPLEGPLEEIGFLSRSENRVRTLETLTRGYRSQRELREELSVSRATMARILTELEDRNWIEKTDSQYETTALGELVVDEFVPLLELMTTVHRLGDVFHLLPIDAMGLDLRSLRSAEVLLPDKTAPTKHMDRGLELLRDTDQFRVLAWTALPEYVTVVREKVIAGDLRFETVLAESFVEELPERPSIEADFREIADAGGAFYRYDDHVPCNMFVGDETVFFWLCGPEAVEQAALVSTDAAVLSWAEETFQAYRDLAEPIDSHTFRS